MQMVLPRPQRTLMNPLELPNLAAWYDLALPASTTSNDIRIDGSNRVSLIADKSGNSATNCLCLNGVAGNYASAPDSAALSITGDLDLRIEVMLASWTAPAATQTFLSKYTSTGNQRSFQFQIQGGTGLLYFVSSADGINNSQTQLSSANTGAAAFARQWVRVTHDVDNGAGGNVVTFFRSTDGFSWTQVSTHTLAGTTSRYDSTTILEIGSTIIGATDRMTGNVYRAQIYNGIGGTLAFDANFATASKLATSFTESSSNAATVTINSSGDLGARISGERDLVQLTASKQPIYLPWSGTNYGFTNGASGTYFSTPDAAAIDLTGSLELRYYGALDDWTPSAINTLVAKAGAFLLGINTSGQPRFVWVDSGSGVRSLTCNAAVPFTDRGLGGVKVEFVPATGTATFYTSTDFSTWTQLGAAQVFGATSIINSTGLGEIHATNAGTTERASGTVQRVQFVNGIGGTVVADFNPSLYTSGTTFTASTGEVWTLNGGATIVNRTSAYFDGSDDYMKAAAFSLSQPETVYFTGQQVSWTITRRIFDGNTPNSAVLNQETSTPRVSIFGGSGRVNNDGFSVGATGVLTAIFNAASSALRINRTAAVTGSIGTSSANGFTLGSTSDATLPSNIRANEVAIYAAAHDTSVQDRVIQYAGRKWGISGV